MTTGSLEAQAANELQGIARFQIHEGKLEEFKRLSAQCMEIVRTKVRYSTSLRRFSNSERQASTSVSTPDRLAPSVLGLGIGLTVQRVLDASVPADTFSEGVRVLLGGAVRASSVA